MAGLNVAARNAMLDAASSVWPPDTASLHTADPGAGASPAAGEVTGGSPAYARKPLTWAAASAASKASTSVEVFDVPACTLTHVGYWRGATYLGCRPILDTVGGTPTPQVFASQGTFSVSAANLVESLT